MTKEEWKKVYGVARKSGLGTHLIGFLANQLRARKRIYSDSWHLKSSDEIEKEVERDICRLDRQSRIKELLGVSSD